jgi:Glycosyl hydrolases family 39
LIPLYEKIQRSAQAGTLILRCLLFIVLGAGYKAWTQSHGGPIPISIRWDQTVIVSRSTPTLQVVVNPMLRQGSPIHDGSFAAVKDLGADYVRYVPWFPYPKLAVAELEPPTRGRTSWDFSLIDPMTRDFMATSTGHSTVMNFSTIPAWLCKTEKSVTYPSDPDQVDWNYTQGTELRDASGGELGAYYARLVSWYTKGGFTDENGKVHASGYHYSFPYWEVLNEADTEHRMTPEEYTARYDAIVSAIRKVSPDTKFLGMALANPSGNPRYFEYFLNHANHKPGIPLDFISYHFYASPSPDEDIGDWQYTFFDQADRFVATVRYIEEIRKRLSPGTKTDTDELGVILPTDNKPNDATTLIPDRYWNAAGALYAYLYIELAKQGIDVIGESQLVGYPSQFPSVSMMDWKDGKPNARYWVLKLIKDNFHPGDTLAETRTAARDGVEAQGFITPAGRKLLLVNKRNRTIEIALPKDLKVDAISTVDEASGEGPARAEQSSVSLELAPFAVAVVRLH